MRGKRIRVDIIEVRVRLIPAYAGKTGMMTASQTTPAAHPRVCGENDGLTVEGIGVPGSSPRMRGKPRRHRIQHRSSGLIPAYAGKTLEARGSACELEAHPRVCGENITGVFNALKALGSSPRMRGKQS